MSKSYAVTVPISGSITVFVESAESKEDAIKKASNVEWNSDPKSENVEMHLIVDWYHPQSKRVEIDRPETVEKNNMKEYNQDLKTDIKHLQEAYSRLKEAHDTHDHAEFEYGLKMIEDLISYYEENSPKEKSVIELKNRGSVSDGYHTFDELYEFRKVYNAALFNEWAKQDKYSVHKSKKHFDGEECFDANWFIVVAVLPGGQISNHYNISDWDLFDIPEYEKALFEFDGHTNEDVLNRLKGINAKI